MLPWFASATALELLAGALESAAGLCGQYISFFYQQSAFEAGQGPKPEGPPSPGLHSRVAGPLGKLLIADRTSHVVFRPQSLGLGSPRAAWAG